MADTTKKTPTAEERIAALESTVGQQNKTIESLTQQLEKVTNPSKATKEEKPKVPKDTFTVDKREFKFLFAEFSYKGHKITALDAMADKDILADLVKMESGVIKEIH